MEIEEIFDIIGSNYSYTFSCFLNEVTPRIATRLIQIIDIRKHNEFCKLASLHGIDMKKSIIKRPTKRTEINDKAHEELNKGMSDMLKDIQNVKK